MLEQSDDYPKGRFAKPHKEGESYFPQGNAEGGYRQSAEFQKTCKKVGGVFFIPYLLLDCISPSGRRRGASLSRYRSADCLNDTPLLLRGFSYYE